jgi:RNA polymerase sigma-70 factor (ECF subfamily)
MSTSTRATLLQRLRDGADALAWDEFFARYGATIYGFARHRGCSLHTAEEIVQDVMLQVFQQRDVYQYDPDRGRFRDWLGAVVRNKVAEHRRRPANRVRGMGGDSSVGLLEQATEQAAPDAAWDAAFENSLLLALLDAVRRETDARTYLAFELLSFEGMSGIQAARITGLSRNAVYKARKRVLERLTDLGARHGSRQQLAEQLGAVQQQRLPAAEERALTARIQMTMHRR